MKLFIIFVFPICIIFKTGGVVGYEKYSNPILETSNGWMKGSIYHTLESKKEFYAFQSIPYAQAPIGKLRFKDPQAVNNWTGILDATKKPNVCFQPALTPRNDLSEDCLLLNIFTPSLDTKTSLPVIFWIHGGFFTIGDGVFADNNPTFFIEENVIIVSINYRLGVFGYLSTGDEIIPGNFAIKDQIMALKWVQNNIRVFGGDPTRVTLMGQSAGAANTALLLQTSHAKDLFSAVIMQSGTSLNLWSRTRNPEKVAKGIAALLRIEYNNSQQFLDELQNIDAKDLMNKAITVDIMDIALSNPADGLPVGPTKEPHGVVIGNSHENLKNGIFNKVPILTGFNSGEGNMFVPIFEFFQLYLKLFDTIPSNLAPIDLNVNFSALSEIGKIIKEFYFNDESIELSLTKFIRFTSDHEFLRPSNEFVHLVSKYVDTYFYEFAYEGHLPPFFGLNRTLPGVHHSEELAYLFYTSAENTPTASDLITRKILIKLWSNFAKYHNPTPFRDALFQNVIWKSVEPNNTHYLFIDKNLQLLNNPFEKNMQFWNSIYRKYGVPPFDTY